jgi:TPR repeat protein
MFIFSSSSKDIDWEKEPDIEEFRRLHNLAEIEPKTAIVGFENLAERGSIASMLHLGSGYLQGIPEKNDEKAMHWYLLASNQGHVQASMIYGRICINARYYVEAKRIYEKMALAGDVEATYFLGKAHLAAKAPGFSQEQGIYLLKKSSDLGHPFASRDLALLMLTGKLGRSNFLNGFPFIIRSISQLLLVIWPKH